MTSRQDADSAARWRLILGRYSDRAFDQVQLDREQLRLERTLDYLYNREYERRGQAAGQPRHGSLDNSQLTAINWLNNARKLFPQSTFERIQMQAVERYQLDALLKDEKSLRSLEPTPQLAKALLSMRGRMNAQTREAVRDIIRQVVEQIVARLKPNFVHAVQGRRNRFRRSVIVNSQNFDWRRTIQQNLKHYHTGLNKLIIQQPFFNARVQRHLPWTVVLCVDQSGSMMSSVMYSAICASILASLPAVKVHLVLFDTHIADLSHLAHDPVEVLLTAQLGGGTDIAKAVAYCEKYITQPSRTIFTLISDFEEGGSVAHLLNAVSRLNSQQVKLLGLAALDEQANPVYDMQMAQKLNERGMSVAALTPEHFAQWMAEVMQ
ncbi:VWA domain-containing protein [Acinetobacter sp. WCHAc010034]|uniref:VWA domain-containing protein n=1 Tax=Acinetobacter sp. WCHAc010034 TaxID=1879049 RepID=UPI00083A1A09|nr:VWA domain-containing protein [Acinetobacter sp. WCHAc010034]AYA02161.1 VWA domain-containing protein [Acinetobacter sp. WCHAc010034]